MPPARDLTRRCGAAVDASSVGRTDDGVGVGLGVPDDVGNGIGNDPTDRPVRQMAAGAVPVGRRWSGWSW